MRSELSSISLISDFFKPFYEVMRWGVLAFCFIRWVCSWHSCWNAEVSYRAFYFPLCFKPTLKMYQVIHCKMRGCFYDHVLTYSIIISILPSCLCFCKSCPASKVVCYSICENQVKSCEKIIVPHLHKNILP